MAEIDSAIGRQRVQAPAGRRFVVEDEGGPPPRKAGPAIAAPGPGPGPVVEQPLDQQADPMAYREQQLRQARAEKEAVEGPARKWLELLIGLGQATADVGVEGPEGETTFSLRTLKGREMRELTRVADAGVVEKSMSGAYDLRKATLAFGVYAVDGADIDLVLGVGGAPWQERFEARRRLFEEMDDSVTARIYTAYNALVSENRARYDWSDPKGLEEFRDDVKK